VTHLQPSSHPPGYPERYPELDEPVLEKSGLADDPDTHLKRQLKLPSVPSFPEAIISLELKKSGLGGDKSTANPNITTESSLYVNNQLMLPTAGLVAQMVNFNSIAWHAGKSSHEGRNGLNSYSSALQKTPYFHSFC
jgi:hypothetical protein